MVYDEIYSLANVSFYNQNFKKKNKPYIEIFYNTKDFLTLLNFKKKSKNIKVINVSNYGTHSVNSNYFKKIEDGVYVNSKINQLLKTLKNNNLYSH